MDEQSLFLQALEQAAGEKRAAWLAEACGGDAELQRRIETLLLRHEQAGQFLESPASGLEGTMLSEEVVGENVMAPHDAVAAPAFDEGAVVISNRHQSVLRSLGNTLDEVPRVSLRESPQEGADPISQPRSSEIPKQRPDSRYRLDGEIARGGMGAILKGRDIDLGRDLAIKVLLDSHRDRPEVVQRFIEEAQIGGQLQHPGIAPVYELGQFADQRPFFSMKLVKGKTLSAILEERKDAAADRAKLLGIFEQICHTMAYAHSRGVIHRDLKPANIMVGAFGEVQVMDWGLAKVLSAGGIADEKKAHTRHKDVSVIQTLRNTGRDTPAFGSAGSETQMGSVMGTPAYIPPEQALGEIDRLDERADVFGLGAILCEILTGKPPYVGDDGTQIFRLASRAKLDACFARLDASSVEPELADLAKRALAPEPEDRLRNASVLAEEVSEYLAGVAERLRQAELAGAEANARAEHATRRRKLVLAIAGLMLVIAVGAGFSALTFRQQREEQEQLAKLNLDLAEENDQKRKEAEEAKESIGIEKQRVEEQRNVAVKLSEELRRESEKLQYEKFLSDMLLVRQAYSDGTIGRVHELLARNVPGVGEKDRRDFEWYFWWRASHLERQSVDNRPMPFLKLVVSPDEELLAVHAWRDRLEIRDPKTLKPLAYKGELGIAFGLEMAFSGDSSQVATIDGNRVRIFGTNKEDLSETEHLKEEQSIERPSQVVAIAFSPRESRLAIADAGGKITFWNTQTGQAIEGSFDTPSTIVKLAFDPTGSRLAALDGAEQNSVLVYDVNSGELITKLNKRQRAITAIAWSPAANRNVVATGSASGNVCLWDGATFGNLDTLTSVGLVDSLVFSSDGSRLVATVGSEQAAQVWETDSSQLIATVRGHERRLEAACFIEQGRTLVSSGLAGFLKKWDLKESGLFRRLDDATDTARKDRRLWLFGREYPVRHNQKEIMRGWRFFDTAPVGGHTALSENREYLAEFAADGDETMRLRIRWAKATEPKLHYERVGIPRSSEMPVDIAISDNAKRVAWVRPGEVGIHDTTTGETWFQRLWHDLRCVALSRDGTLLAISDGHHTRTWVFDIRDGKINEDEIRQGGNPFPELIHERCYQLSTGILFDSAFSPDGEYLALATSHTDIILIDARSRQEVGSFRGHAGNVWDVAFSSDGSLLASAGEDRTVRVWDFDTRALRTILPGHESTAMAVTFSTNSEGRQTITSMDGASNVFVWSAATKAEVEKSAAYWLARAKRHEELGDLKNARLDRLRAVQLGEGLSNQRRFELYKEIESWSHASQLGLEMLEGELDQTMSWIRTAPVVFLTGDLSAYREFCTRAAKLFSGTDQLEAADQICKSCLLSPDSIDVETLPHALIAERLDQGEAPAWLEPWLWTTRALVAYRSRDADSAAAYVSRSEGLRPTPTCQALNLALRALFLSGTAPSNQVNDAVQAGADLIAEITQTAPEMAINHDILIPKIILEEAKALQDNASERTN